MLIKPAIVVQWHRQGFSLFWRWRSRSGRPSVNRETSDLIRQMNAANPLWGAPRVHGELLKFDSLLAPFQCQFMQLLQIAVQIEFLVGTG